MGRGWGGGGGIEEIVITEMTGETTVLSHLIWSRKR